MSFQRIFLLSVWFIFVVLYFFLNYKSTKKSKGDFKGRKLLFIFEQFYRYLLIIVFGSVLLWTPINNPRNIVATIIILTGIILLGGGCVFLFWARYFLKENWTEGWTFLKEGHQLITGGPYKIVRHPIYLAFLFMLSGTALVMLNKYFFIFVIAFSVVTYLKAKSEEKTLLEKFGSEYENYKKTVPMLFPFPRRFQK